MNQLAMQFEASPMKQARTVGQIAAELAEARAERKVPNFSERAGAHILEQLAKRGPLAGEVLSFDCINAGIRPPDARAFGAVFARLQRAGLIVCVRSDLPRSRGHGTTGGKLWRLAR